MLDFFVEFHFLFNCCGLIFLCLDLPFLDYPDGI